MSVAVFLPPPQPRLMMSAGAIGGNLSMPQSARAACPEFIPPTMSEPRIPSGLRVLLTKRVNSPMRVPSICCLRVRPMTTLRQGGPKDRPRLPESISQQLALANLQYDTLWDVGPCESLVRIRAGTCQIREGTDAHEV
jgi:hypothetical protein